MFTVCVCVQAGFLVHLSAFVCVYVHACAVCVYTSRVHVCVHTEMAKLAEGTLVLELPSTLMVPLCPQWSQWHIFQTEVQELRGTSESVQGGKLGPGLLTNSRRDPPSPCEGLGVAVCPCCSLGGSPSAFCSPASRGRVLVLKSFRKSPPFRTSYAT